MQPGRNMPRQMPTQSAGGYVSGSLQAARKSLSKGRSQNASSGGSKKQISVKKVVKNETIQHNSKRMTPRTAAGQHHNRKSS